MLKRMSDLKLEGRLEENRLKKDIANNEVAEDPPGVWNITPFIRGFIVGYSEEADKWREANK